MNILLMIIKIILKIVLPASIYSGVLSRAKRSKDIFLSTKEMRQFFYIVLYPINLLCHLIVAFIKMPMVWLLTDGIYSKLKFLVKQFYFDICDRHLGVKIAFKRAILFLELVYCGRERKVSFGDKNPDKVFYVLRPYYFLERNELVMNVSNLLFHYYRNLQHLAYGVEKGWIPVVDWENYGPFAHGEDFPVNGSKNCWEYYWEQPSGYTLSEVYQSKNVVLSVQNTRDIPWMPSCSFSKDLQRQAEGYFEKCPKYDQLIKLNKPTQKYINARQKELFPDNARILGVAVRGSSYGDVENLKTNASGHPIQPKLRELIEEIERIYTEWNMDYIFVTCEMESVIDVFKDVFKDKVISLPRLRYEKPPQRGDVERGMDRLYLPGQKHQTNLDYLTEMVLLSRCTSIASAMSSGTRAALIWNNHKYENIKIFDKGLI